MNPDMRASLNCFRIQLDHAKLDPLSREEVRDRPAWDAKPRDDRVAAEEMIARVWIATHARFLVPLEIL